MAQTSIQKTNAIRYGSGILSMGASTASLTNLGAIRDLVFRLDKEDIEIDFDNTDPIQKFRFGDRVTVTCLLAELDGDSLALLDAGWITVGTTAGTPVAGATQTLSSGSWNYNNFYKITNQNGDGSAVTINSVTGGTDGALSDGDGFHFGQDENGNYGIYMGDVASELTTESQDIVIDYDYTPNASKDLTFTSFGTKTTKYVRIVNTNAAGNTFQIDMEECTNMKPLELSFPGDEGEDVMMYEIEIKGKITSITDSQSTT